MGKVISSASGFYLIKKCVPGWEESFLSADTALLLHAEIKETIRAYTCFINVVVLCLLNFCLAKFSVVFE